MPVATMNARNAVGVMTAVVVVAAVVVLEIVNAAAAHRRAVTAQVVVLPRVAMVLVVGFARVAKAARVAMVTTGVARVVLATATAAALRSVSGSRFRRTCR